MPHLVREEEGEGSGDDDQDYVDRVEEDERHQQAVLAADTPNDSCGQCSLGLMIKVFMSAELRWVFKDYFGWHSNLCRSENRFLELMLA